VIKNYIKSAFKNIKKRKGYSFINIIGLGVGIASCILIFLWVHHQLSYDQFHVNRDSLHSVNFSNGSEATPPAMADYLKKRYGDILNASRFNYANRTRVKCNEKEMMESGGAFVDPSFSDMFTLKFYKGNAKTALLKPESIVLTKSLAIKYFGNKDALGETLIIYGKDLKVTGLIEDYPTNSYIQFKFLMPFELLRQMGANLKIWTNNWHQTYVQLHPKTDLKTINKKISGLVQRFVKTELRTLLLRPMTRLYLYNLNGGGKINIIIIFSIIAIFILLIACINFINLSTVQFSLRMKEVGLRKTLGAHKKELVIQFFIETFLLIFIAWLIGLMIFKLLLPEFNMLVGETFIFKNLLKWSIISGIIGLLLISGLIAGSYPALFISSFKPIDIFKGQTSGTKGIRFRKGLVIFQFILSIILIFGTLVLSKQLNYLQNKPLGYHKDNVVTFPAGNRIKSFSAFKNNLLSNANIIGVTTTNIPPYRWNWNAGLGSVQWEDQGNTRIRMVRTSVDYDYAKTFGLKLVKGRFFSSDNRSDVKAWVVNEAAVKAMGMTSPIGKWIRIGGQQRPIIGVVKDYHFESLKKNVIPMTMSISSDNTWACVKINQNNISKTISFIKKQWREHSNNYPFEYNFLDEQINQNYLDEKRMTILVKYFGILAIILSCLGMFGLASFLSQSRTKEIGIRKILGSTKKGLLILLSRDFIKWVVYAMLIAWPMAWLIMNKSLQIYAYKIKIGWEFFVISGGLALIIAVFSISFQVFKTTRINPIESLRNE